MEDGKSGSLLLPLFFPLSFQKRIIKPCSSLRKDAVPGGVGLQGGSGGKDAVVVEDFWEEWDCMRSLLLGVIGGMYVGVDLREIGERDEREGEGGWKEVPA